MEAFTIQINNRRVYEFYTKNPNINIETMNLLLLDFINQIGTDMTKVMSNTLFGEILSNVKEIKQQVNSLTDTFSIKILECNKEFIDTIKLVIGASTSENIDKISLLLNKNTDAFVEKINVCIPKTQEQSSMAIQEKLVSFKESINMDIKSFLSSTNNSTMADFIDKLDSKIVALQQPIYTFLSSNQEQITSRIDRLKDETTFNKTKNDGLMTELGDFLSKYKTSSQFKGQCSENMVGTLLNKMYPTAEIINTTAMKASGDFILKRTGKPDIMIENKNYEANVNIDETKKFIRDANEVKTHAIMMSQFSGIVSKPNGFIEINDGNVLIYLHNVDYSQDKIKMAIDIIDNLSVKLDEITNLEENSGHSISKECLERINDEYQKFQFQKETLITTIKDMNKKMLTQVDDFKLPNLSMYLNDKFASVQNQQHICEFCSAPFQTKRSLASHKKLHKTK